MTEGFTTPFSSKAAHILSNWASKTTRSFSGLYGENDFGLLASKK